MLSLHFVTFFVRSYWELMRFSYFGIEFGFGIVFFMPCKCGLRGHLDDVKKYVPEFIPEFVP